MREVLHATSVAVAGNLPPAHLERYVAGLQDRLSALPGVMIFVTSLCLNLLSDGLRSAMNVRD